MHRPLVMLVCLSAVLAAQGVYLPEQGPVALRFQPRAPGRVELPPLISAVLTNEPVTVTNVIEITNVVTVTVTNVVETAPLATVAATTRPAGTNVQLVAPSPEAQPMSPALLMQYFRDRKATNPVGTAVVAPIGFTPPPVAMPSSTATFEKK